MAESTSLPTCSQGCASSIAMCITCNHHFCWEHFLQHHQRYEKYLDDKHHLLSVCLDEYDRIENKLRSDINNWEIETSNEVHRSADYARRTLDAHINSYRSQFDEESSDLRTNLSTTNRNDVLSSLEKLQIEYGLSLNDLRLVKYYEQGPMLDVETKNAVREQVIINRSSQEADVYVAQTALGARIIQEPSTTVTVGSYWAIGGSNTYLLVQEYENGSLTLFDCHGEKSVSLPWDGDTAIRDINWHDELQRFFILLDKKLILFDPVSKHFEEITQVKPYQSNTFRRCSCFRDRLFITYWGQETHIELIRISTWEVEQSWLSPVTCRVNELITCIRLNSNNQLGLCIQDESDPRSRKFRFEIRDIALNILHTLQLSADSGIFSRMTTLPDLHWALLNVDENFVFVVNQIGELIDRVTWPRGPMFNIALVGQNTIVIRTSDKLHFYDVEFHVDQ